MSEQNILNPVQSSMLGPDWGYSESMPETRASWQAQSGKLFTRRQLGLGRVYELPWNNRDLATKHALQQWERQYENDFFSIADWERGRYFSGRFAGPLGFSPVGNNRYNVRGQFVELPGLPMFAYPTNWARDAIFIEERNGFGEDLLKLTGSWDRHSKNYLLQSEALDSVPWGFNFFGAPSPTVNPNTAADPNGIVDADQINFPATAAGQWSGVVQSLSLEQVRGWDITFSIWLRAATNSPITLILEDFPFSESTSFVVMVTPVWTRFSVTRNFTAISNNNISVHVRNDVSQIAKTIFAWGGQVEYGTAPSPYTKTLAAAVELSSPIGSLRHHGGFAYRSNVATDMAEWLYFGYGFRLWTLQGGDLGQVEVTTTRVSDQQIVDYSLLDPYSAGLVNSSAFYTKANLPLGFYRVKVRNPGTRNALSNGTWIYADAIEVMQ